MSEEITDDAQWSQLMAQAQKGDHRAYEKLLRDIVPYIRTIAAHHHHTADVIDDVVQDVLLTVHRARHTYDPARPLEAWLAAITRRRSIDTVRRRARRSAQEGSDDAAYKSFADPATNSESEVRDTADVLSNVSVELTARQRKALELVKRKVRSFAEAFKASGQSVVALKVNVHRVIRALRAKLAGGLI